MSSVQAILKSVATNGDAKNVDVVRSKVPQIQIPEKMSLRTASDWLLKKDKEEDKDLNLNYQIDGFPLDGAVAFRAALDEIYGFVSNADTPGWFGPNPPVMIGVPISETVTKQVPWGRVEIPGVAGYLETSMAANPTPKFVLTGQTKQRHLLEIEAIVEKTKEILRENSIYRGKAVRLDLTWVRLKERFNPMGHAPQFTVPTSQVREEELIFPASVQRDIELGLFTPIEQTQQCRNHKIPLKRGVLLAGEYGCGKTLTAYVTAKKAVQNGWTFIYLSNVLDLAEAFKFAKFYAPAVIFAEDVDRVVGQDERTEAIDAVLNSFDGVDTKGLELITVLTTNHLDKLTQAILRPGRCDTLVQVTRPDKEAAARLVKLYGRGLIALDADFEKIGVAVGGHLPAEIREAVERAKLAAIRRLTLEGNLPVDGSIQGHVREQDVIAAVEAMESQHKLLEPKMIDSRSIPEKCSAIIGQSILAAATDSQTRNTQIVMQLLNKMGMSADTMLEVAGELVDAGITSDDDEE